MSTNTTYSEYTAGRMPRLSAYEEAFDEDDEEDIGDTEEGDIIARLQASKRLYEDESFPAKRSSLYRCGTQNCSRHTVDYGTPQLYCYT